MSIILIPVIDTGKNIANFDQRLNMCKLKKDLLKELLNYKSSTYKNLSKEEIEHLYTKLTNKLSVINNFKMVQIYMTIINFNEIIGKKFNTITNNVFCLSHPNNALIIGKTNSGKTNILFNLIAQNCIFEKNLYLY